MERVAADFCPYPLPRCAFRNNPSKTWKVYQTEARLGGSLPAVGPCSSAAVSRAPEPRRVSAYPGCDHCRELACRCSSTALARFPAPPIAARASPKNAARRREHAGAAARGPFRAKAPRRLAPKNACPRWRRRKAMRIGAKQRQRHRAVSSWAPTEVVQPRCGHLFVRRVPP
jgi:hypothetical protein